MKHNTITLIAFLLGLTLFGCKKYEQENLTPKIKNDKVEATATTATFTWTVDWPGKLISVVEVSENEDMSHSQIYGSETETENHNFTVTVTDLEDGTKYFFRYLVWNKFYVDSKFVMEVKSFTTLTLAKPTVTTASVNQFNFTNATAVGGGEVTSDGNDLVIERGIYYGTTPDPATTGTKLAASSGGTGNFTCTMTGLVAGKYYVCAFATNRLGTSYGSEKSFSYNPPPPPTGAINGIFSVSSSKKVYFSRGNLQYRASDGRWHFAEHQYDYIGDANSNISSSYSNIIDLFGWGTSGWNSGNTYYHPYDSNNSNGSLYGPSGSYNLAGNYANADWGVYNKIYNGGNTVGQWRTLTKDEWVFVFQTRSGADSKYGYGKVNDVCGMILLPDSWKLPSGLSFTPGNSSWANVYTAEQWSLMEANGAIFLPAAGLRYGTWVDLEGRYGSYWSASYYGSYEAYRVDFGSGYLDPSYINPRYYGFSVRLVTPAE